MRKIVLWMCIPILLMSCTPSSASATPTSLPSATGEAYEVLIKYFARLNSKQYAEADALYGGDYEQLKIFSEDVNPADHAKLWSNACELAGLQCLGVRSATLKSQEGDM